MSDPVDGDSLLMLVSTLPDLAAPEAAALRVRARARAALSRQQGRRQWQITTRQSVVTGALAAGAASYVVSAVVQALHAYRVVW